VKAEATKRAIVTARRVASDDDGDGDCGKSNGDGDEGAGQVTTRAMAAATTVVGKEGKDEGNCDGSEGGEQRRG
jgi:hypothetical protein